MPLDRTLALNYRYTEVTDGPQERIMGVTQGEVRRKRCWQRADCNKKNADSLRNATAPSGARPDGLAGGPEDRRRAGESESLGAGRSDSPS